MFPETLKNLYRKTGTVWDECQLGLELGNVVRVVTSTSVSVADSW